MHTMLLYELLCQLPSLPFLPFLPLLSSYRFSFVHHVCNSKDMICSFCLATRGRNYIVFHFFVKSSFRIVYLKFWDINCVYISLSKEFLKFNSIYLFIMLKYEYYYVMYMPIFSILRLYVFSISILNMYIIS